MRRGHKGRKQGRKTRLKWERTKGGNGEVRREERNRERK